MATTDWKTIHARHEAFYAVKLATGGSLARIGRIFGRDDSTVINGIRAHKVRTAAERLAG